MKTNPAKATTTRTENEGRVTKTVPRRLDATSIVKRGLFVAGSAFALCVAGSSISAHAQDGAEQSTQQPELSNDNPPPVQVDQQVEGLNNSNDNPPPVQVGQQVEGLNNSNDNPPPVQVDQQVVQQTEGMNNSNDNPPPEPGAVDVKSVDNQIDTQIDTQQVASIVGNNEVVSNQPITTTTPDANQTFEGGAVDLKNIGTQPVETIPDANQTFEPGTVDLASNESANPNNVEGLTFTPTNNGSAKGIRATDENGAFIEGDVGEKGKPILIGGFPLVKEDDVKINGTGIVTDKGSLGRIDARLGGEDLGLIGSADTANRSKVGVEGKLGEDTTANLTVNNKGELGFGIKSGQAPGAPTTLSDSQLDDRIDYRGLNNTVFNQNPTTPEVKSSNPVITENTSGESQPPATPGDAGNPIVLNPSETLVASNGPVKVLPAELPSIKGSDPLTTDPVLIAGRGSDLIRAGCIIINLTCGSPQDLPTTGPNTIPGPGTEDIRNVNLTPKPPVVEGGPNPNPKPNPDPKPEPNPTTIIPASKPDPGIAPEDPVSKFLSEPGNLLGNGFVGVGRVAGGAGELFSPLVSPVVEGFGTFGKIFNTPF